MANEQELLNREERGDYAPDTDQDLRGANTEWDINGLLKAQVAKLKAMGWKSPEEYRAILSILIHEVQHTKGDELNKLLDSWVTANNLHPELVETVSADQLKEILTGGE